ncbi:unnamed protein product [Amoebophrya sp. A25]|nr:unnamed protein product [Amoebophrya sp. A25]|eukprot:GSA25T00025866001.1
MLQGCKRIEAELQKLDVDLKLVDALKGNIEQQMNATMQQEVPDDITAFEESLRDLAGDKHRLENEKQEVEFWSQRCQPYHQILLSFVHPAFPQTEKVETEMSQSVRDGVGGRITRRQSVAVALGEYELLVKMRFPTNFVSNTIMSSSSTSSSSTSASDSSSTSATSLAVRTFVRQRYNSWTLYILDAKERILDAGTLASPGEEAPSTASGSSSSSSTSTNGGGGSRIFVDKASAWWESRCRYPGEEALPSGIPVCPLHGVEDFWSKARGLVPWSSGMQQSATALKLAANGGAGGTAQYVSSALGSACLTAKDYYYDFDWQSLVDEQDARIRNAERGRPVEDLAVLLRTGNGNGGSSSSASANRVDTFLAFVQPYFRDHVAGAASSADPTTATDINPKIQGRVSMIHLSFELREAVSSTLAFKTLELAFPDGWELEVNIPSDVEVLTGAFPILNLGWVPEKPITKLFFTLNVGERELVDEFLGEAGGYVGYTRGIPKGTFAVRLPVRWPNSVYYGSAQDVDMEVSSVSRRRRAEEVPRTVEQGKIQKEDHLHVEKVPPVVGREVADSMALTTSRRKTEDATSSTTKVRPLRSVVIPIFIPDKTITDHQQSTAGSSTSSTGDTSANQVLPSSKGTTTTSTTDDIRIALPASFGKNRLPKDNFITWKFCHDFPFCNEKVAEFSTPAPAHAYDIPYSAEFEVNGAVIGRARECAVTPGESQSGRGSRRKSPFGDGRRGTVLVGATILVLFFVGALHKIEKIFSFF